MNAGRPWVLAFALLLAARLGSSQTTGSIEGRVLDAGGRPLRDVPVTARSPSLQGVRTASTDPEGHFLFLALPPGEYVARAELES
jgi:protocatechuate 3,4-dioxygenase beta subunit